MAKYKSQSYNERVMLMLGGLFFGGCAFYLLTLPNVNEKGIALGLLSAVLSIVGFAASGKSHRKL